jgi:hypothetical protein
VTASGRVPITVDLSEYGGPSRAEVLSVVIQEQEAAALGAPGRRPGRTRSARHRCERSASSGLPETSCGGMCPLAADRNAKRAVTVNRTHRTRLARALATAQPMPCPCPARRHGPTSPPAVTPGCSRPSPTVTGGAGPVSSCSGTERACRARHCLCRRPGRPGGHEAAGAEGTHGVRPWQMRSCRYGKPPAPRALAATAAPRRPP